ncbi:CBS domain-containing protein [Magnetococcus sp. PR-3]|uniref:CBS domain-containing protein n=1 Tax=Magnetococcus sp. PR-3 TaxID=3120355 RepID=UPI002FCDE903
MSDDKALKKLRPFVLKFFNRLSNDMNMLTGAPVSCTLSDSQLLRGLEEIDEVFELDKSVARAVEDGTGAGDAYICFDLATSIALAGYMMMMGEGVIKEQVKKKIYTDEIQEGFQEVANQLVGAFNDLVEDSAADGHMLLMLPTERITYGEYPNGLEDDRSYCVYTADIQVGDFDPVPSKWLFSRDLTKLLTGVEMDPTESEKAMEAEKSAGGGEASEDAASEAGDDLAADSDLGSDDGLSGSTDDLSLGGSDDLSLDDDGDLDGGFDLDGDSSGSDVGAGDDDTFAMLTGGADSSGGSGDSALMGGAESSMSGEGGYDTAQVGGAEGSGDLPDFMREPMPSHGYSENDGLPNPSIPGSVQQVMSEAPFTLKETDRVIKAINAMRRDGYKFIGIDNREGKLIRVLSTSDIRHLMGPFFGTKSLSKRDKVIYTVPLGKLNTKQDMIAISIDGSVAEAADLVTQYQLRAIPVLSRQGVLRGFVTSHSLVDFFRRKRQM